MLRHNFLIVPALTDQAGQCRIVHRITPTHVAVGLNDYRDNPGLWKEVGIMASDGHVVCLDAWPEVWQDMRYSEPLMASTVFSYKLSEADIVTNLFARLQLSPRTEKDVQQCAAHLRMFCPSHFASSDQAMVWLSQIKPGEPIDRLETAPRFNGIFDDVVQGLREYHPMLDNKEVVGMIKELLAIDYRPSLRTQDDYELLRDALEALVESLEKPSGPRP